MLLSATLRDSADKDWRGDTALVNLPAPKSPTDLAPSEPFPDLAPINTTASGETVVLHGAPSPACFYVPNPPYSDEARKLKVNGYIIAEAVINSEGRLENLRISRGLPGGLNETTLATMRTWRCHPAQLDGKTFPTNSTLRLIFIFIKAWVAKSPLDMRLGDRPGPKKAFFSELPDPRLTPTLATDTTASTASAAQHKQTAMAVTTEKNQPEGWPLQTKTPDGAVKPPLHECRCSIHASLGSCKGGS